ncbi:MAG: hypothetical protein Q8K92_01415 [Leadbetterella sp.]|nr:hypothetical protein [Leadbetterella sp.]
MKKVFLSLMLMFSISFAFANIENNDDLNTKSEKKSDTKIVIGEEWVLCLNLSCRTYCMDLSEDQLPGTWGEYLGILGEWEEFLCQEDDGWGDW